MLLFSSTLGFQHTITKSHIQEFLYYKRSSAISRFKSKLQPCLPLTSCGTPSLATSSLKLSVSPSVKWRNTASLHRVMVKLKREGERGKGEGEKRRRGRERGRITGCLVFPRFVPRTPGEPIHLPYGTDKILQHHKTSSL